FRVAAGDFNPRIRAQLLQTQRYTVALAIELEDLDVDFVADVDDFARVLDTFPGHVGNVQQTIDTAQIDECAVIGEVLDHAFDGHAFLQRTQQLLAFGTVGFFKHGATGNHDVVAFLVEFDDFELELFAFQVQRIPHRAHVDQRTRQERADAVDVDGEAAFDLAVDDAFDDGLGFEGFFQIFPGFCALRFLAGETGFTPAILDRFEGNLNFIANLQMQFAAVVQELLAGNHTFGLEAGVYSDPIIIDIDDHTGHDRTRVHLDGL